MSSVRVDGLRELRRDLKQIDATLPRKLNAEIKRAAEPMRAEAARNAPRRTGRLAASLKVGTAGSKVRIYSKRDGASVIHWGGRHPLFGNRQRFYAQKANPFIARAAERGAGSLERDLAHAVEALMRNAGFQ